MQLDVGNEPYLSLQKYFTKYTFTDITDILRVYLYPICRCSGV